MDFTNEIQLLTKLMEQLKNQRNENHLENLVQIIKDFYNDGENGHFLRGEWFNKLTSSGSYSDLLLNLNSIQPETTGTTSGNINVQFRGFENTPYSGQTFNLVIHVSSQYPRKPLTCYTTQPVYHVNVE